MKKIILLLLFCLMSKSAFSQDVEDYFPLAVGDEWLYRAYNAQYGRFSDSYNDYFKVIGTETINDTTYFVVNNKLSKVFTEIKYYRKDNLNNVYVRYKDIDQPFLKFDSYNGDKWYISALEIVKFEDLPSSSQLSAFGILNIKSHSFINNFYTKDPSVFTSGYGCTSSRYEDFYIYLKRVTHDEVIITPRVSKINSVKYDATCKKIFLLTYAVMDTTNQIILDSKRQGVSKGSLKRYSVAPDYDRFSGPRYTIESNLDLSIEDDTIRITVPATVSDILGDKVDGNGNQIWEGSPMDDFTETVIIPSHTNNIESQVELSSYKLNQNYPNPFNPSTKISFSLPVSGNVKLIVYDLLGKEIKTLINEERKQGSYEVNFDASTAGGLSSGIYIYSLQVNNFVESKKMFLIK